MANRRMTSKQVVQTEKFLRMPSSAQALYFHLVLCADDAGVVDSVSTVCRMCNQRMTGVRTLLENDFILEVADDRILITDWLRQNKIQPSRMQKSEYLSDLDRFEVDENNRYRIRRNDDEMSTKRRQDDDEMSTKDKRTKESIKDSVKVSANVDTQQHNEEPRRLLFGSCQNVFLSLDEYDSIKNRFPLEYDHLINRLSTYMAEKGKTYTNHYATLLRWGQEDAEKQQEQKQKKGGSFDWLRDAVLD